MEEDIGIVVTQKIEGWNPVAINGIFLMYPKDRELEKHLLSNGIDYSFRKKSLFTLAKKQNFAMLEKKPKRGR